MDSKLINVENVSKCSIYELRQELLKRNAFDLEESQINYKNLLQRLIQELLKDEAKSTEKIIETKSNELYESKLVGLLSIFLNIYLFIITITFTATTLIYKSISFKSTFINFMIVLSEKTSGIQKTGMP